jgi:predicted MFS family arabinose efflux permease
MGSENPSGAATTALPAPSPAANVDPTARSLRLLQAAAFWSSFDRMAITPLLVTIAAAFDVSLSEATLAATTYFLLYGASQPFWGLLTDRFGRVAVMRFTLAGAALAAAFTALAPTLVALIVARGCAGLLFGATIPTALVYVGDTVAIERRQGALADLMGATAAGLALATVLGGFAVDAVGWRVVFALPAIAAVWLAAALRFLPEPHKEGTTSTLASILALLRRPWPLVVLGLVLVEGTVALGYITFFAPALEEAGFGTAAAGGIVGVYGLAVIAWTRVVKVAMRRLSPTRLLATGAVLFTLSYLAPVVSPALIGIAVAALLNGGGFAFMHSTLQTWATHVAPDLRATAVSLFAACLFLGGALATAVAAPLAGSGHFRTVFAIAAATCLPLGVAAVVTRHRYDRLEPGQA